MPIRRFHQKTISPGRFSGLSGMAGDNLLSGVVLMSVTEPGAVGSDPNRSMAERIREIERNNPPPPTVTVSLDVPAADTGTSGHPTATDSNAQLREYGQGHPVSYRPEPSTERIAQIDRFIENKANATSWVDDNGGENVGAALIGDSELGELTVSEQNYLARGSVEAWKERQSSETIREAADAVEDDPLASRALANAMSEPAAEEARHFANGGQYWDRPGALGFRHEMLAHAVRLDPTRVIQNFEGVEASLGKSAVEEMPASHQIGLLNSVAAGRVDQTSADRLVTSMFFQSEASDIAKRDVAPAMAAALARVSHPDLPNGNTAARTLLETRLTEVMGTNGGRELLFGREIHPEQRAWALEQVSTDPTWTADALENGWESDLVTTSYAQSVQDRYNERGTDPQELGGEALRNTIGQAIGLAPDRLPGDGETAAQRDARLSQGLNHQYYSENARLDLIAEKILGDDPTARVSIVPVTVTTEENGATVHTVFRVERENGEARFVDDRGLVYEDLNAWETESRLPQGRMTYPTGLVPGADLTDPRNTPKVVDSFWEHAGRIGDAVALGVGVVAGVALVVGSGGTALLVAAGASGGYAASRAGAQLHDDHQRGIDITDLSNPEVRNNWIDLAAGTLSVAAIGGGLTLAQASKQGVQVGAGVARSVAATQLLAEGLDTAAGVNQIHSLATNWDQMSNAQRAAGLLETVFWGGMAVASTRSGGARTQDALSFTQLSNTLQFGPDGAAIIRRRQDNLKMFESDGFHVDRQAVGVTQQQVDWMLSGQSPLGFESPQQFADFQSEVRDVLRQAGLGDTDIEIKGTATSFYSENPGKPLGHHFDANPDELADIDLGIASDAIINRMQALGFEPHEKIPSIYRTRNVNEAFPELADLAQRWETILGREVNFVAKTSPDLGAAGPYDYRLGE